VEKIQLMFDISPQQQISLKYTDNDGDLITVRSQEELEEAFRSQTSQIFRFKVSKRNEEPHVNNHGLPGPVGDILKTLFDAANIQISVEKDSPIVHKGITCDGCNKTPVGVRYKCTSCFDFDLCENCESKSQHDPEHLFLKIKNPLPFHAFQWRDPIFHSNMYHRRQGPHGPHGGNAPPPPFGRCPRFQRHFQPGTNCQRPQGCRFRRQCEFEVPSQPTQEVPVATQPPIEEQPLVVEQPIPQAPPQEEIPVVEQPSAPPQELPREELPVVEGPVPVLEPPVRVLDELEVALSQLVDMGFPDRSRNIDALIAARMDISEAVRQLL